MKKDHVYRRQTPLGRWLPAAFYTLNLAMWMAAALMAGAWRLLYLALLPLAALAAYMLRTQRGQS